MTQSHDSKKTANITLQFLCLLFFLKTKPKPFYASRPDTNFHLLFPFPLSLPPVVFQQKEEEVVTGPMYVFLWQKNS